MNARNFALWLGIAYLGAGILGFVPAALRPMPETNALAVTAFSGYLLGLFPVNLLHTLVHVAAGAWGVPLPARWPARARGVRRWRWSSVS